MDSASVRVGRPSARLRRLVVESPQPLRVSAPSAAALVATAIWVGLATGLGELALTLALEPLYDPTPGLFRGNRHVVWIIPIANLATFSALGVLLGLLHKLRVGWAARFAPFLLTFVSLLSLLLVIRGMFPVACAALAAGVAARLARPLAKLARAAHGRRLVAGSGALMVIAVAAIVAMSWGRDVWAERAALAALAPAGAKAPNVLLVVLDTVRADHLTPYGYHRDTAPNLARLAERGVTFDRARSTASWTLPSHASLMTGCWPHELSASILGPLDGTRPTIAEAFEDAGYSTSGFVANTLYCSAEAGIARGFIHYEDHILNARSIVLGSALGKRILDKWLGSLCGVADRLGIGGGALASNNKPFKDAAEINREFLTWQSENAKTGRPFFAFLNYFDAHDPYLVPPGYKKRFGLSPESRADQVLLSRWWGINKRKLKARDVQLATDAYDDCIGYLDQQLGVLFETLEARGALANTIVIVTSDHGEHFGEHDLFGHASSLYQGEVRVPLVVMAPAQAPSGARVSDTVSLRDLPSTLADLAGLAPAAAFPGGSLRRFWTAQTGGSVAAEPVLSEVDNPVKVKHANNGRSPVFRGPMQSVALGDAVYIRNGDGREELYDLATDPGELHDLAADPAAAPRLNQLRAEYDHLVPPAARHGSSAR